MELLTTILVTLATLGVLITFHEYGHFWVARKRGVKVQRFSIGFGPPLLRWRDRHNTEFVLAALPLGGYVKMLDEREGNVPANELDQAFNRKSVWSRIAIVAAGPIANLLLAIAVLWLVFLGGERGYAPIIASTIADSPAAQAGLPSGEEIVAIDGVTTETWQALNLQLLKRLGESGSVQIDTQQPGFDAVRSYSLQIDNWLSGEEQPDLMQGLGIELFVPPVSLRLAQVVKGSPAEQAGLRAGDRLRAIDGQALDSWEELTAIVQSHAGQSLLLRYRRDEQVLESELVPAASESNGKTVGRIGVMPQREAWPEGSVRQFSYSPWGALVAGAERTWELSVFTLQAIKKMLFGQISAKNLSGPISIAQYAGDSAEAGWRSYLGFLALLSVSLGVLNLLPIPVLDGGHLMFYAIEVFKGSPVSDRLQLAGQQIGLVLIVGVMMLAIFNDVARL